ncbi:MAG: hypothetical protein NVS1B2_15970 [Vulcanimicrobiaceae bacterium]
MMYDKLLAGGGSQIGAPPAAKPPLPAPPQMQAPQDEIPEPEPYDVTKDPVWAKHLITHSADNADFLNGLKPEQRAKVLQMLEAHAKDSYHQQRVDGVNLEAKRFLGGEGTPFSEHERAQMRLLDPIYAKTPSGDQTRVHDVGRVMYPPGDPRRL